jgi:hypothetical protein
MKGNRVESSATPEGTAIQERIRLGRLRRSEYFIPWLDQDPYNDREIRSHNSVGEAQ